MSLALNEGSALPSPSLGAALPVVRPAYVEAAEDLTAYSDTVEQSQRAVAPGGSSHPSEAAGPSVPLLGRPRNFAAALAAIGVVPPPSCVGDREWWLEQYSSFDAVDSQEEWSDILDEVIAIAAADSAALEEHLDSVHHPAQRSLDRLFAFAKGH